VSQQQVIDAIRAFNEDPAIHGILVQLPLPATLNQEAILNAIHVSKDVDGFHTYCSDGDCVALSRS
jgi:methylenetetrahydrofolate dehydrogenase (NADP+)/methenyltetrahydrofolate cyclohydrolase